jgi:hypothetical protein
MIDCLDAAPHVRLVLLAGSLHGGLYLNEFLRDYLPACGDGVTLRDARLEGSEEDFARPKRRKVLASRSAAPEPAEEETRGFVRTCTLVVGVRRLPVYFCSSGPSNRRNASAYLVAERVERDARDLRERYLG